MALKEEYKDLLGFTWKKEGNKYVQYTGDGKPTGKTKNISFKDLKQSSNKGDFRKYYNNKNKKKVDINNPQPGDTKKTQRRRVGGKWIGGETLVWNGTKWVKPGDSSLVPNRAMPGDNKADPGGYRRAVKINESLKINKKTNNNSEKNVSNEKVNNEKVNNEKVNEKVNNNGGPNLEAANEILKGNKKEVTMKDFQSENNNKNEKTEGTGKKESKWIRNPKTKTLVRRTSQKGKQLLKIAERKRKLREKRFGKK